MMLYAKADMADLVEYLVFFLDYSFTTKRIFLTSLYSFFDNLEIPNIYLPLYTMDVINEEYFFKFVP